MILSLVGFSVVAEKRGSGCEEFFGDERPLGLRASAQGGGKQFTSKS